MYTCTQLFIRDLTTEEKFEGEKEIGRKNVDPYKTLNLWQRKTQEKFFNFNSEEEAREVVFC